MASNSTFYKANGYLRLLTMFMGVISIGLTASKFRRTEFNDLIFLAALAFTTLVSFIHFFLTFLSACVKGRGKCFKITDFLFHFTGGILLLVSSIFMLMGAPRRGNLPDYRFQDTTQVLIRTTAGVLGLQNSIIYFILSYLTITDRRLVYCTSNNPANRDMYKNNGLELVENQQQDNDKLDEGKTSTNSRSTFFGRFTWRRLLADEILEARILTLLLGILNGVLIADSYQKGYELEEYFLSMVVVSFCLSFLSQSSYAFHIIRLSEAATVAIDVILHLFSSLGLLIGGTLMLGSVIQNDSYGYQQKSIERTSAALVGIFNGLVYCHIGMNVKRAHFHSELRTVTYLVDNNPTAAVVIGKGTRKTLNNNSKSNEKAAPKVAVVAAPKVEPIAANQVPKNQACAVS